MIQVELWTKSDKRAIIVPKKGADNIGAFFYGFLLVVGLDRLTINPTLASMPAITLVKPKLRVAGGQNK